MQLKKRISAVILVILLTGANLAMFKTLDLLDNSKPALSLPIPKNVNWKVRLNIKTIAKKELYTILFQEEDPEFLSKLRTLARNRFERFEDKKPLHINWEEDILVYSIEENKSAFQVYLLQTKNATRFNENISDYLSRNQMGYAIGSNAVLVTQKSGKRLSKPEMESLSKRLLNAPKELIQYDDLDDHELIDLAVNNINDKVRFQHLEMKISQDKQAINFSGKVEYPEPIREQMSFGLKYKGIYIYSRFIPKQLPDTLLNFLPDDLPHFKDISSFALDYQGMNLEDPVDHMPYFVGHMLVPKMNLIIRTEKAVKIEELWSHFPENVRRPNLKIELGKVTYHLKQLDKNTYFIGIDPNSVTAFKGKDLFILKGDLRHSTQIYGGTFITAIIENMGPMKALNQFIRSTDTFNFQLTKEKAKVYKLTGTIDFKSDKYPLHELTRFILNSPIAR